MNNKGLSPDEYFALLDQEEMMYRELTRLKDSDLVKYKELLQILVEVNSKAVTKTKISDEGNNTFQKGKALEELVSFLLEKTGLFNIYANIRSTTNEIDQLLELSFRGKHFQKYLPFDEKMLLSECKNYNKKIDVTWVGKFYSLLVSNHSGFGFLFSYYGMTGKNWDDATGLTKKIFLLKEKMNERIYILDFNINDFRLIAEGSSFLELIGSKILALKTATNFDEFLKQVHPALENS